MRKIKVGERTIIVDKKYLTVRKRRDMNKKFDKEVVMVEEDKVILEELKAKWGKTPPSQMEIYEGFLRLRKDALDRPDEYFREELLVAAARNISRWEKPDGTPGDFLTEEEYEELPADIDTYIRYEILTKNTTEVTFLEATPVVTSA